MAVDERLLSAATAAAEQITAAQREVDLARSRFQRAVRALYLDGGSLREIAAALDLSHQRVHQLLDLPAPPPPAGPGQPAPAAPPGRRRARGALDCSFCGRTQEQAGKLIAGNGGIAICDRCVALGRTCVISGDIAWSAEVTLAVQPLPGRCPFCGAHTGVDVPGDPSTPLALVTAPGATGPPAICEECLTLCEEIIADTMPGPGTP